MATNDKATDINKLFKDFGFNTDQISKARELHRNAIKLNKKHGGGNELQDFKKTFHFDEKIMREIKLAHEAALKLNKTRKITKVGGNSLEEDHSPRSSPRSKSSPGSKSSPRSGDSGSKSSSSKSRSSSKRRTKKLNRFDENDLIDGNFHNLGKWFPGKINKVHRDGTYDIDYFDGRQEEKVDSDLIRMPAEQPQKYSMISTIGSLSINIASWMGYSFMGYNLGLVLACWSIIGQALDTYVDGQIMQNTDLVKICKLIEYVFPKAALMYLVYAIHYSLVIVNPAAAASGSTVGGGEEVGSEEGTVGGGEADEGEASTVGGGGADIASQNLAPSLKNGWTDLLVRFIGYFIDLAKSMTGGVFAAATVAWMGYFVYTRFSKNKEKNAELDRAIYSNHKRRFIIMQRQKTLQAQKEKEAKEQQRYYEERLEKQLELEKKSLVKEQKKKANRYRFVRGQNDANSQYLFNRTLKRSSRTSKDK